MRQLMLAAIIAAFPFQLRTQNLSLGLIAGGSLTDAVQSTTAFSIRTWSPSKDWIAGATLELHITPSFSVEVDGMYRELHATIGFIEPDGSLNSISRENVVTWEFPVLAKYRFGAGKLKPFVEAGPAFRTTGNLNFNPSHHGVAAGIGVETRWRGLDFAPVLRYTRWTHDANHYGPAGSQVNQLELLLSISHPAASHSSPMGNRLSLGAIAGWGLTNDVAPYTENFPVPVVGVGNTFPDANATEYVTGVKSLIAGPSLEIHLPRHLAVEVDALHKSLRESYKTVLDTGTSYSSATYTEAATWQFPVLVKYRFQFGKVSPFLEAGPAFRLPQEGLSTHGVTAGLGIEGHLRALHIAPALRFTHWASSSDYLAREFTHNEAAILLGISIGGPARAK